MKYVVLALEMSQYKQGHLIPGTLSEVIYKPPMVYMGASVGLGKPLSWILNIWLGYQVKCLAVTNNSGRSIARYYLLRSNLYIVALYNLPC